MAQTVDGVVLGMQTILENPESMAMSDHKVMPLPWRDNLLKFNRKLRIGW